MAGSSRLRRAAAGLTVVLSGWACTPPAQPSKEPEHSGEQHPRAETELFGPRRTRPPASRGLDGQEAPPGVPGPTCPAPEGGEERPAGSPSPSARHPSAGLACGAPEGGEERPAGSPSPSARHPSAEPAASQLRNPATKLSRKRSGTTPKGQRRAPKWVLDAHAAGGPGVYGVGRSPPLANRALARTLAENRARAALARKLAGRAHEPVVRHLRGVEIIDHWTDPRSGAIFARAHLADGHALLSP